MIHSIGLELTSKQHNQMFDFTDKPQKESWREQVKTVAQIINHPFYFYHLDELRQHIKTIKKEAEGIADIWYATKSNPLGNILDLMNQEGMKFDVASPGECAQVLRQGINPANILCTGPAKSRELLKRYLHHGVRTFVLESHNQLKWLNEVCKEQGIVPQALLRLQLTWDQEESSVLGGNLITPFGLEDCEWEKINLQEYPYIDVVGVHSFQWGNILDEERLTYIWTRAAKKAKELSLKMNFPLQILDLGGGIGIPYDAKDEEISWKNLMGNLKEIKTELKLENIWLELGRYAVGGAGGYITKIVDKKQVRGKNILVLDSGMNQIARPTLTGEGFPIQALTPRSEETMSYQIHGPLCTAMDALGDYNLPTTLEIGDWLLFTQCGAYGFTESMPYFLCHSLPGEAVIENDQVSMVRMPRPANHYLV